MKIIGYEPKELDQEINSSVVYYNRNTRIWVAYNINAAGDQVGNCGYGASRSLAEADANFINIKVK